jgi:6-phosphogluconolactonase
MKLKNIGRAALATALSLGIGLGATACSRDYTVAYVYAISKASGSVAAFAVDYQSGALTQINGSPFAASGSNPVPVAAVASPSGKYIYVINNFTSSIEVYAVGTDGKLYGQSTPSTVGSFPTSAAIDSTGSFLYVTVTLQPGFTTASPGKGGIDIFPITASTGALGTPTFVPTGNNPVSIAVSAPYCYSGTGTSVTLNASCNNGAGHYAVYAYVLDQEGSTTQKTAAPTILGFTQNMSTGALTLLSGSICTTVASAICTGYAAGVQPTGIAVEPTTRYVYVTDASTNQILGYQIASNTTGNLTGLVSSPTATGLFPIALTIDPRGKFLLTANYNSSTIGSYTINSADGSLGGVAGTSAATVATGPTCVAIEPALGIYVYSSNLIDGSLSGEQMNASTGALTGIANTPFPTSTLPSCVVAVANGSHAQSIVNP